MDGGATRDSHKGDLGGLIVASSVSGQLASGAPGRQSLWPGFLKRHFESTAWAETILMCGEDIQVRDVFMRLKELNYQSSIALRKWAEEPLVERRATLKSRYKDLTREIDGRQGARGKAKRGAKRQRHFMEWSDGALQHEVRTVSEKLDWITSISREGNKTSGEELTRPCRSLPMYAGMLLTGFGGAWIKQGSCITCGSAHATARCHWCQCGICENHGILLSQAWHDGDRWQGVSKACCVGGIGCDGRQQAIVNFWKEQTGEDLQLHCRQQQVCREPWNVHHGVARPDVYLPRNR